jgi:hypothetical protein
VSAAAVLRLVLGALAESDVPYMLVGSFASTVHGAPRTTQDIDLVIDPTPQSLSRFVALLESSTAYVGPDPLEALERRDQFNVVDADLAKLEWSAMSSSDRQLSDAATVLAVRGDAIDQAYLDRWAAELGCHRPPRPRPHRLRLAFDEIAHDASSWRHFAIPEPRRRVGG